MKIFHGKGTCSIGNLVVLEEAGLDYDVAIVNLAEREQVTPEYMARNPKSKVPTLELDSGEHLTEWPAIAAYAASLKPETGLLPTDALKLARTLEAVDYVVSTMHMQGFTRMVRPGNFTPNEAEYETVKARGLEIVNRGLELMNTTLADRDYLMGDYTIADAALFYVEHWMVGRMGLPIPANTQAHYERMLARDAVKRALARGE